MAQLAKLNNNNSVFEERSEEIISPIDGKPTIRISRFLKPIVTNTNFVASFPETPFVYQLFYHKIINKWPFQVNFTSWKKPHKDWGKWYYKLVVNHATTWLKAGILDGIHSSMHIIPCNKELVLGVCEFWCPKTNTFMFPWGEATITLEDVMVLCGFPVVGGSVCKPIEGDLVGIVDGLNRVKGEISSKVVTHSSWIKHFMKEVDGVEEVEGELEHVAFLALWLSRFVFPDLDESVVKKHVFPIAAHLSKGTPICIAPIVLANLYHDLTLLVEKASNPSMDSEKVNVFGLFQIVQLWVSERFPLFAENLAKPLGLGDPRVARWDNVKLKLKLPYVRSSLMLGKGFRWRPYADGLDNWEILPFYEEKEQTLDDYKDFPHSELSSYSWFCQSRMLVGIKGSVEYNPHRVSMQLGFDQDLPGVTSVSDSFDHAGFLLPSRNFEPGMTRTYHNWWKESMSSHKEAVRNVLKLKMTKESNERIVMHAPPIVDVPMMVDLQPCTEKPLKRVPSSLEGGEIREVPEIPRNVVIVSHVPLDPMSCHKEAVSNTLRTKRTEEHNEKIVAHQKNVDGSSDFSRDMQVRPVVDAPVMCDLLTSPESPLERVTSSLEEGEIREVHEIPNNEAVISPGVSKSNSKEIHASVTPQSLSMLKRSTSQFRGGKSELSKKLEHVPLALRICTKMVTKKYKTVISGATTLEPSNSHDIDHVPLAVRLQTNIEGKWTPKPIPEAVSWITRQRSCLSRKKVGGNKEEIKESDGSVNNKERKDKLEVRVAKLEKVVAKIGAFQFGPKFLDSKTIDEE